MKPGACARSRHHTYVDGVCKKCGEPRRPPGRPRKVAGPEGSARLAATLGVPPPAATGTIFSSAELSSEPLQPDQVLPPKTPEEKTAALTTTADAAAADKAKDEKEEKEKKSKAARKLCRRISRKLTKLFNAGTDALIESFDGKDYDREAGEADEEDIEDFEENLAEVLAARMPDVELTPGVACILAGAMIVGDKCLGSTKIPKAKPSIAGATKPESATPSTTPAAPTEGSSDVPAAGTTSNLTLLRPSTS